MAHDAPPSDRLTADEERKLEQVRRARAEQEEARERASARRELAEYELEERLTGELKGPRGEAFEIVSSRVGVFGVRKPDTQAVRTWEKASDDKKFSHEWQISFLRHQIVPEDRQVAWMQLASSWPVLASETATAFVVLMGLDRSAIEKKR